MSERCNKCGGEFLEGKVSATTGNCRDCDSLPKRDAHEYYGSRYSIPAVAWIKSGVLLLSLVRWDYRDEGWVLADLMDGPSPCDYDLDVTKWTTKGITE